MTIAEYLSTKLTPLMGSWDLGSFDNDTAVDWTHGLENASNLSYIKETLDNALDVCRKRIHQDGRRLGARTLSLHQLR